jgi:hypothetical protein
MTTNPHDPRPGGEGATPDALRWQLRALRQDAVPDRDLWAGIEPRLQRRPQAVGTQRTPWLALAASLLLVAGVAGVWQARPPAGDAGATALVEARRLSADYRRALDALPAAAADTRTLAPAIDELDRSAAQIRRALARDPDSRLLLEQLRRTYARRLALSQRVLVG